MVVMFIQEHKVMTVKEKCVLVRIIRLVSCQNGLSGHILTGRFIQNILVQDTKNRVVVALVVGYVNMNFMYGKVSDKRDVYAFGVVLLELISGREPIHSKTCKGRQSLVSWAKPILESGDFKRLVATKLQGKFDVEQMNIIILATSICITRDARHRPTMN
ncbi:unnamed protein product [Vicia faba]|uniref:Serine-threonine/tyrosine-protein kinase catalytic domain-containing protein n=1 Tax=Vicia faba TaxID=3906 RepID=A0AAV0YH01_VICFA|nr:unnamed protein product [Vicia faba]